MLALIKRYILLVSLLFGVCFSAYSQHLDKRSTYPFKVSISVQGSSVYLSDYANEFSCPVSIYLTCLDPSITRISVRLQIGIKAGGFTCQTTPYATVTPIDISFGQTYHLTDAEVAEYFLPQNISHSGLVNGRMPESLADFTVQVLEYNTGVKLSSVAYTMRPLRLLSPVRLISPQDKTKFTEDRANNILFTWSSSTPPNATDQVEYEFILKELTDTVSSVQSAFNYAPIVYTETTPLTSLIYSLDKPALEVGKKYAWCVKTTVIPADGVNGKQYVDNAGYSTVYSFEVSRPTPAPVNSQITKTEEEPYHNPHCGEAPVIDLSNKTPIESLKVGDTIMAGDFPIVLLEVTGSGGTFSGKGSVEIPWISRLLRFAVEFEGIGVNTDKRLISGQIEGVRNGTLDNIANLDAIDYGSTREVEKAVTSADISLGVTLPNAPPPSIAYNPTSQLLTFYNETGAVVAETTLNNPQGKKVFPITVQDAEGNLYQVEETTNEDGTAEHSITHVGKQGKHLPYKSFGTNVIDEHIAIVTFEPTDSPYSFDTYQEYYKDIPLIYKKNTLYPDLRYPHMGHGYYTPWQFIPLGEKVTLSAKIKINDKKAGIDPKKVIFTTEEGLSVATSYNEKEKTYTLTVPSAQSEGYYILHALYQTHDDFFYHLGQIGIDTRKPISARVVLVPMGGDYNLGSLSAGINSISKQVGLTWQVEEYTDFEYSSELTANLFEKNSGVLFSYNDVQTVLNSALKAQLGNKFDPSACYVFMFDKAPFKNDRNIIGFMPRGGKFGYIHCQGLSSESLAQILTHELMHGQFLLRHTFDDKYANGLKQGVNPTNLMDYKGGRHLAKWQWDQIYDPAITTSLIKYDEDGEWTTDGHYYTVQLIALMMGLDEQTAFKLGQASENPDTRVYSNEFMTERITWMLPVLQQKYHALTGGYHGVELAITAYALLKTHTDDESLKFLLHRLGDCFAHFDIVHDKEPLTMNVSLQQYVDAIDSYLYENIPQNRHKEWIEFMLIANHTAKFEDKTYKEVKELVLPYLPTANQNKFVMYGEKQTLCFTFGHADDNTTPDHIVERKKIFLLYIEYIIEYITLKYRTNGLYSKDEIINRFEAIIDVLEDKPNARLDAIFAYETEKLKNNNLESFSIKYNLIGITSFPNVEDVLQEYLIRTDKDVTLEIINFINYHKFTFTKKHDK